MTLSNKLSYLWAFTMPLFLLLGYFSNIPYMPLTILIVWILIVTILDKLGKQELHFSIQDANSVDNSGNFELNFLNLILFCYLILNFVLLFTGLYYAHLKPFHLGWLLAAIPVGASGALSLLIAHEIMHTNITFERYVSRIAAIFQFWGVHEFEHLYLHHRDEIICTPIDTSYAPLGMSIYRYFLKNTYHNFANAWRVQKEILNKKGKSIYSWDNFVLLSILSSIIVGVFIFFFLGIFSLIFFLIQALTSIALFSLMTYYQHYGLTRRKKEDGSYEDLTYMNMWNTDSYFSNRILFNLPRHGHHHLYQFCRYYHLKYIENSPRLPGGYFYLMPIALIPPLWYKMMDERAKATFIMRDNLEKKGLL